LESSRPYSLLSRASLPIRRVLLWSGPAKPDAGTQQTSPGAAFPQGSLQPFRTSSPGRARPGLQAWPATGGAVLAPLRIARANTQHLETVLGLIEDARSRLWTKDTDQWEKPWPNRTERDARVLAGLKNEKTWIVWDGDIAAATVTLTTKRNTAVWSKPACTADLAERAVFIHRLITSRKYAGQGLGAELIDWAGLRGGREYGAKWIRIDVWTTNTGLHDYYMNKGFRPCGTCADSEYPSGALFEKRVAESMVPTFPKFTETSDNSQFTEPPADVEETAKFDLASY
jgi:GNAT superfamily N-acetyltransferase